MPNVAGGLFHPLTQFPIKLLLLYIVINTVNLLISTLYGCVCLQKV